MRSMRSFDCPCMLIEYGMIVKPTSIQIQHDGGDGWEGLAIDVHNTLRSISDRRHQILKNTSYVCLHRSLQVLYIPEFGMYLALLDGSLRYCVISYPSL